MYLSAALLLADLKTARLGGLSNAWTVLRSSSNLETSMRDCERAGRQVRESTRKALIATGTSIERSSRADLVQMDQNDHAECKKTL